MGTEGWAVAEGEIHLVSDGDGLAVIGETRAVDRFLSSEGLTSKELGLDRLGPAFRGGAAAAQAGATLSASSGRWVQLTKESASLVDRYGLRQTADGLSSGVVKGQAGQIRGFVEFARGPAAHAANPAMLAGAAGIMAQLAMQQAMDEIADYLASIEAKVDDVLRAQKDAVVADMIGVGLVVDEAMTVRDHVGRVSDVTWSKVQSGALTVARTQAYALRQLDGLAEKLEGAHRMGRLADVSKEAPPQVQEWLAVLARSVQLQDAIAVLELDRVLDGSPDELDAQRRGLSVARHHRLQQISRTTTHLLGRMDAAADTANSKVLLNPAQAPSVVKATNQVASTVTDFHGRLGIDVGSHSTEARRWREAAADARDRALEAGADGVDAARTLGSKAVGRARSTAGRLGGGIARRVRRKQGEVPDDDP